MQEISDDDKVILKDKGNTEAFTHENTDENMIPVIQTDENTHEEEIGKKMDKLVKIWRIEYTNTEFGIAVKRMSYLSRATQLYDEIEKVIVVDDNKVLIKMQEKIKDLCFDLIATD